MQTRGGDPSRVEWSAAAILAGTVERAIVLLG